MNIQLCPQCGEEMSIDYVKYQGECFNCGHVSGRGIRTGDLIPTGKYEEKALAFPGRFRAVIYRVQCLWMANVEPDAIAFEFAAEVPDLRSKDRGFSYRLISVFAANGFPWPTDFGQMSKKDTRAKGIPTHIQQLRDAIAGAIATTLGVPSAEVRDMDAVIHRATTPDTFKKRRK